MVPVRDFSGLESSPWALARAAAMAPMVSLERCMIGLHLHEFKADRPRFRAFGPQAMADSLLGILRHQLFQVGLGALVLHKGGPGSAEHGCKLCPAIGITHIDDTDRLQPRSGRFDPEETGLLPAHY